MNLNHWALLSLLENIGGEKITSKLKQDLIRIDYKTNPLNITAIIYLDTYNCVTIYSDKIPSGLRYQPENKLMAVFGPMDPTLQYLENNKVLRRATLKEASYLTCKTPAGPGFVTRSNPMEDSKFIYFFVLDLEKLFKIYLE